MINVGCVASRSRLESSQERHRDTRERYWDLEPNGMVISPKKEVLEEKGIEDRGEIDS